jgi:phosphosulfolactate phosphohydrolase-like enzyme
LAKAAIMWVLPAPGLPMKTAEIGFTPVAVRRIRMDGSRLVQPMPCGTAVVLRQKNQALDTMR